MAGLTEAEIMRAKGYSEKDVLQADVQKAYAAGLGQMGSNGGGGGSALGDIAGLGVTLGAMGGWNCACGQNNITSNFCPNCGAKKPALQSGWTCPNCGAVNISSNFCPNCGARKPEPPRGWDCACGTKNIMSNFCPNCGKKREDN